MKKLNIKVISATKYDGSSQVILNLKNEHDADLLMHMLNRFTIILEPDKDQLRNQ